jgi:hypothetical protein
MILFLQLLWYLILSPFIQFTVHSKNSKNSASFISPTDGSLELVSRYYVAKRLRISQPNLTRWIKNKHRILAFKVGAQRLRASGVASGS